MTRVTRTFDLADVVWPLLIGPTDRDPFTFEDLEVAWRHHRDELLRRHAGRDGRRPWGWWEFEAGEEQPRGDDETVRLAELGELTDAELAALHERATEAGLRIGTPAERLWTACR